MLQPAQPSGVFICRAPCCFPYAVARVAEFLAEHLSWSAFRDKRAGLRRVAENDPDSDLYAESRDADAVIRYMRAHS